MEIISYVGAAGASAARSPRGARPLRRTAVVQKERSPRRSPPPKLSLARPAAVRGSLLDLSMERQERAARTAVRLPRAGELLFALVLLAICVLVPMTVFNVADYVEGHTDPLSLQVLDESEVEFLDGAMAAFAMNATDGAVDADGNVLADDGSVLTAASVGVGQAVTFSTYKVQSGDTISTIARRFGLTNISTLIAVNDIANVRTLWVGQKLRVPSVDGLIHTVAAGETLNGISARYKVSMEELLDANDLDDQSLHAGQELFIPGARMDATALKKAMGELFAYPIKASWRLTSRFGRRADPFTGVTSSHTGIDMACPTGTPIYASMSGKVVVAGWNNIFGNYVIIDHENGYQTLYGHMSKILTTRGARVNQGARIGLVGSTGYSTGPHLHFTVYKNGKLVDPQSLLK